MTMQRTFATVFLGTVLIGSAASAADVPTPSVAVEKACEAAGGTAAFKDLDLLKAKISSQEVTQDGTNLHRTKALYFQAPGPVPGRVEIQESQVIAGDDGTGGWALVAGKPDSRPGTTVMIERLLNSDLFPLLLPFSLTWDGVAVVNVAPADIDGRPTWRLGVQFPRTFFHTPQISTTWTVDLDRTSFEVVRADSPATDLGRGIRADGMRYIRDAMIDVKGVKLPRLQRIIGLSPEGMEKAHSRIDEISYDILPESDAAGLFANPVPPDQRPKLPIGQPPAGALPGGGSS